MTLEYNNFYKGDFDIRGILRLTEIADSELLTQEERTAVEKVYNFLKAKPSTIVGVSECLSDGFMTSPLPQIHATYIQYAVDVLKKNNLIKSDSFEIYSVKE